MKRKIIAISGGELKKNKTFTIDQEIIRFSNKKHPTFLFIPTASYDDVPYIKSISAHFSKLGCIMDLLLLKTSTLTHQQIKEKIMAADIIYVGGGNTMMMMKLWRKLGIDRLLDQARKKGTLLTGLSAGCICWFSYGNSNALHLPKSKKDFIKVKGLGFIDALVCPHFDREKQRKSTLVEMVKKSKLMGLALDEGLAIQVLDNTYRIIGIDKAQAYKIYWKNNTLHKELLEKTEEFLPLKDLLKK